MAVKMLKNVLNADGTRSNHGRKKIGSGGK